MKSNAVFYISENTIKFFQVSAMQKKQVTGVNVIDISKLTDPQISEALNVFQKKLNLKESRVTVLIPRSRAILRTMVFPSIKEDEIRSMIALQLASHIPYAIEEVEIDFQVLSKTGEGYSKVAVVVIPQDIAMRYWNIFSDAKIAVSGITISSVGLWLLYQQLDLSDAPGAVFDLDIDRSEICLCYKSQWLTSREIPVGFEQMQKDGYENILNQWELTQNKINSERLASSIESVYLVTSANRAYALAIEMGKIQPDLKIKEFDLTKQFELARGVQWPKTMTDEGVSMASLAGIASSSQLPPIDLIPRAVKQAKEQQRYQNQLVVLGVWAAMALISMGIALGMGFFKKNLQLAHLDSQLRETKREAFAVEDRLKKINEIEGVIKKRLIFSNLAHELYRLLPSQVYLVNVTISDADTLSLEGVSSNAVEINQFQRDMVTSQMFTNVSLDYVNKRVTQQGEVDYFKITSTLTVSSGQK